MIPSLRWRTANIPRLVAGTAQLGMPYGIANAAGRPSGTEAVSLIESAWEHGVRFFDTAQAYGESEAVLGTAFQELGIAGQAMVLSKIDPRLSPADPAGILRSIEQSCERLRVARLWGMLLHRPEWLGEWGSGLGSALEIARRSGMVRYLGVSVYSVEDARAALANADIDLIQAPSNAWDQRMLRAGVFTLAASLDKLCFVRSVYLQGLLVLSAEETVVRLPRAAEAARRWHELARNLRISPATLAVRYALALPSPLVIGMETREQLVANAALCGEPALDPEPIEAIGRAMEDVLTEAILNPALWSAAA